MKLVIKGRIAEAMEQDLNKVHQDLTATERDEYGSRRNKYDDLTVDLGELTRKEVEELEAVLRTSGINGTKVLAADVRRYLKAADEGVSVVAARTVRQAAWLMEHYIAGLEHHVLFNEDKYGGTSHVGYYVEDVNFIPKDTRTPAKMTLDLVHIYGDVRRRTGLTYHVGDVFGKTAVEVLREDGYIPENPALMLKLKAETERFYAISEQVGVQFLARGVGVADLDDATATRSQWGSRTRKMAHFGVPARVVVDVLNEKDDDEGERRREDAHVEPFRWHKWNLRFFTPSEDEIVRHMEADDDTDERPVVEVPVHPVVPTFDLRRHERFRVHVNNMEPYVYDRTIAKGLVLPARDLNMIDLLVDHASNEFRDVVSGKGQSMNILSEGAPGTGKTLTAEVFAEFKGRPLYAIQCAELGQDPAAVEKNLAVHLTRANRWNAVLLLDEADVFIRKRGDDLQQNAIVAAFLRLLEYSACILFMTTNLGDNVDDAIASRCIARLRYVPPAPAEQARIWRILADLNKLVISDAEILKVATRHPTLTGRDVKNLLKLASFISEHEKVPLDAEAVERAMLFKPTQ